ncbi:hypothetical protein ZIOFF_013212 [Zingiber officinale]|uniref:Helicase ATP-binding domain-containing protein n=1 Tax=Zingiber officinale TaxID=94328 RepID=A0A8J5H998_ZINOF|nr:hypothetical protein ZIOFF_013212 [Zingiber officinale]
MGCSLEGAHLLTPLIEVAFDAPYDKSEEEILLNALFCGHIRGLLYYIGVQFSEQKINELSMKFNNISAHQTTLMRFNELRSERKHLRDQLREFWAALRYLLVKLGELVEDIHFDFHKEMNNWDDQTLILAIAHYVLATSRISVTVILFEVIVLIGESGSGKSTQLAQYLADSGFATRKAVVCTQPCKIAANTLAQRVREEANGCYPNSFVLSYSSDSPFPEFKSGIIFMTAHCLLQHFMNGTSWEGVSCIIIDEAHERSLNTDLLLALIKKKLLKRPELHVIIMSATADATKFSDYLFGCNTYYVMGRNFPVEIKYVADVSASPYGSTNIKVPSGKCLSWQEKSYFLPETSLTIKGIKYVVDSGMVKESRFEPRAGLMCLRSVQSVKVLLTNEQAEQEPEIRKVFLGVAVLRILALGIKNVDDFEFVDAPCPRAVEIAIQNIIHLGAVTRKGEDPEHLPYLTESKHDIPLQIKPDGHEHPVLVTSSNLSNTSISPLIQSLLRRASKLRDVDEMRRRGGECGSAAAAMPGWLGRLMEESFFVGCGAHGSRNKNEKNIFCLTASISCRTRICPHCAPSHPSQFAGWTLIGSLGRQQSAHGWDSVAR